MSHDRLPPLNALRAFDSAARHLSFARAAEELDVTPGAISQQIRVLEDFVGQPLFRRMGRSVELTDPGRAAAPALREAFEKLHDAARLLHLPLRRGRVAVSAAPSFAAKWLVPRLESFQERHPDVEVWVSADMAVVDFAVDDVDVALRYGAGLYSGVHCERLLSESVVPVCSPSLQERLKSPRDLAGVTLLHDGAPENDPTCPDWAMWLKARGVEGVDPRPGPRFNQGSLAIEAATAGRGVALAKRAIAQSDLDAGRLVIPFADEGSPVAFAYHLVWPRGRTLSPAVKAFIAWVREMAQS
jgi:LysR family transcriptional regulator, glycine cleavage system transcriptional activator